MYNTPDERRVIQEGERLRDMYHHSTEPHKLGKTLLCFVRRRSKMLKLLSQLTWLIRQTDPKLIENIAYQEATSLLKAEGAQVSDCNQPKFT